MSGMVFGTVDVSKVLLLHRSCVVHGNPTGPENTLYYEKCCWVNALSSVETIYAKISWAEV